MCAYVKVIDLTSKPKTEASAADLFKEPDPPIPETSLQDLPDSMKDAVRNLGWKELMPVQSKAIPYMLASRDIIVQSKTGSGKTGAFLLPLLEKLDPNVKRPQSLILTPTRELARQIHETFQACSADLLGVSVYGGVGYGPQIKAFKAGAQLVVGTPGRVLDHLAKGSLKLDALRVLVLDEADEMLSVGFWPAMQQLRRYLPRDRESYMFSATMPYRVQVLAEEFLKRPGFLSLGRVSVDKMRHRYTVTSPMDKNRILVRMIELENPDSAIIFVNTKKRVEYLTLYLQNYGFDVRGISGDLSQKDRERVMEQTRSGRLRFLVATDVAARGIDISDLSHILIYDVPLDPEYYVHRAGRTARAGKTGVVISLATLTDEHVLKSISKNFGLELEKVDEPPKEAVESHVSARVIELLEAESRGQTQAERDHMARFLPMVTALMEADHVHWLSMLFDEFYHESLHVADSRIPARTTDSQPPQMEELITKLESHMEDLSNVGKERLQRFVPLVTQLIDEGEPELPALILARFWDQSNSGLEKKSSKQTHRKYNRPRRRSKPRNRK